MWRFCAILGIIVPALLRHYDVPAICYPITGTIAIVAIIGWFTYTTVHGICELKEGR